MTKRKNSGDVQETEPPSPNRYDGRYPFLQYPGLFPSKEAMRLGESAERSATDFFSAATNPLFTDVFDLRSELTQIASTYIQLTSYASLPKAEEYREHANRIKSLSENLMEAVLHSPEKSLPIDQHFRRRQAESAYDTPPPLREALRTLLSALVESCNDVISVKAQTSSRPRDDLRVVAARLAELWQRLTGHKFPMNMTRGEGEGEWGFQAEGPQFVYLILKVFNPSVTTSEVRTALRKRTARKPNVRT